MQRNTLPGIYKRLLRNQSHIVVISLGTMLFIVTCILFMPDWQCHYWLKWRGLRIGAGNEKTGRYALASKLVEFATQTKHKIALDDSSKGSADVEERVAKGELDAGIIQGGVKTNQSVRQVAAILSEPLHLLVRKDAHISRFDDLTNRIINVSVAGSGTQILAKEVLEYGGIKQYTAWHLSYDEISARLKHPERGPLPDAAFVVSALPGPIVTEMLTKGGNSCYILLDIPFADVFSNIHQFSTKTVIPRGIYSVPSMLPSRDITTIGTQGSLIVNANVPDEVIGEILRLMYSYHFAQESPIRLLEVGGVENKLLVASAEEMKQRWQRIAIFVSMVSIVASVIGSIIVAERRHAKDRCVNMSRSLADISRHLIETAPLNNEQKETLKSCVASASLSATRSSLVEGNATDVTPMQYVALAIVSVCHAEIDIARVYIKSAINRTDAGLIGVETVRCAGLFELDFMNDPIAAKILLENALKRVEMTVSLEQPNTTERPTDFNYPSLENYRSSILKDIKRTETCRQQACEESNGLQQKSEIDSVLNVHEDSVPRAVRGAPSLITHFLTGISIIAIFWVTRQRFR